MAVQTYGWKDLHVPIAGSAKGSGAPTLANFGPSGSGAIKMLSFAIGDSVYLSAQLSHAYMPDSLVYPHVHWSTNGTDLNTTKWQITYVSAKGHDQENFGNDVILTMEQAAAGSAWRHMTAVDLGGFNPGEPTAAWIMELKRISNGGTDNADTVFALFVDAHFRLQQPGTNNPLPPFYT